MMKLLLNKLIVLLGRTGQRITLSLLQLSICLGFKQDVPPRLQLFLLIGQSNMAGRGVPESQDKQTNPHIWVFTKQQTWTLARDPLHFDKPNIVGVGPGMSFAQTVLKANPTMNIGLIPCAVGGSGIDVWEPGAYYEPTKSHPYDDAIQRAKKALENGQLAGILWHQGESDSEPDKAAIYEQKLSAFVRRIRADLQAEQVPFLVGTIGDFFALKSPASTQINAILTKLPNTLPNVYLVSVGGLTHKGDSTHFDTASARALGQRYATVYLNISKKH